ncbi:EamA family transporter [Virgibacillus phasianinus]|uniref:EamA family transporter n=1 Tax=Virgibacillus phasianinus TaxID=2017483 RepID=A0A220U3N0_9BACI|nr:DMT family transporter [Virgibacillus phasianinus]ASK62665.1 EamA family transporter [Virgibacillus phasianinus]
MVKRSLRTPFFSFANKEKWMVWLLILLITLIWGYAWVLMKEVLNFMGPFTFSAFRFGTGTVVLLILVYLMRTKAPPKKNWIHLIVLGILQTSIVFLLVMYGLSFVGAGKASVLLYSMPIWSTILAVRFLQEKVTGAKITGLGLGMLGLLMILGWDLWIGQEPKTIVGEILIVVAAMSWGASNVYYRIKLPGVPKLQVNAYQMLFGTIGILIAAFITEWGEPVSLTTESIYYILFTGVLASALCFTVWFMILSMIDTVTATLSTLLVPVFGLFLGWLILGEKLSLGIIIGSICIIVGIIVAQITKK